MSDLLTVKREEIAQKMGWTLLRAEGYVDGETTQQSGQELPAIRKDGMDEYSQGFRTGYYTQACALSESNDREALMAH